MKNIKVLGIDLAKSVFQLHGANQQGKAVLKKKLMGDYKHPVWLSVAGWVVVIIMGIMGAQAIVSLF